MDSYKSVSTTASSSSSSSSSSTSYSSNSYAYNNLNLTPSVQTDRYYHYLDDDISSYYTFDLPYWTRFQDEYERLRSVLKGCELMLNDMTHITSNSDTTNTTTAATTTSSDFLTSTYVPTYTSTSSYVPIYKVPYNCVLEPEVDTFVPYIAPTTTAITTSTTSEVSMSRIESEISSWRSSIDELASLLSTFKGRSDEMENRIVGLLNDKERTYILMEEFGMESILREMEEKRKTCDEYCVNIYDALSKPHYTYSVCK